MSPSDARRYIEGTGVRYGQDVTLPDDVDVTKCEEFFGTRCSENVHVTGSRKAHVDRVDPRKNPIGHLKKDVGIPYVAMTTPTGALIGAIVSKNNRKKGALVGGLVASGLGLLADVLSDYYENKQSR